MTSYSVLLRTYAKYWYAKTGTLKPSHHVPKNLLAQRKPRICKKLVLFLEIQQLDNCDDLEKGFVESAFPLNFASMELKTEP